MKRTKLLAALLLVAAIAGVAGLAAASAGGTVSQATANGTCDCGNGPGPGGTPRFGPNGTADDDSDGIRNWADTDYALPILAEEEFQLAARSAILSFIVVFGVTKAITNYLAGRYADRGGRKRILVAGWLVAAPVPFILMWAPTWPWILFANGLLGVSQGFSWSTTVISATPSGRWQPASPLTSWD